MHVYEIRCHNVTDSLGFENNAVPEDFPER